MIKNLIYIFQLENYDKRRFLSFVYKKINWFTLSKRNKVDWTIRAILLFLISLFLFLFPFYFIYIKFNWAYILFCFIFLILILPFIIIISDLLISPLVIFKKVKNINSAKKIISHYQRNNNLITIGITGSYGKTTMKNVLISILSQKYKVFTFPGNINTDIGIANYILKNKNKIEDSEILVAEMGAYKVGDIKALCNIIQPIYSITTSIGESHLDRFGSFENIVSTKFELANHTDKISFLNNSNNNIDKFYSENIKSDNNFIKIYGKKEVSNINILDNFEGISFFYKETEYKTKIIAEYIIDFIVIALKLADELGLNIDQKKDGVKNLEYIPHRLEVIKNEKLNRVIIDDSYNGNYNGFLEGINILKRSKGKKIVLTPGIVELGEKRSREIHEEIAEEYSKVVDYVLLIKTEGTNFIVEKFKDIGYNEFKIYKSTESAHKDLTNILKNGDTIIFQNDITDNYL